MTAPGAPGNGAVLTVDGLHAGYGAVAVVHGVALRVHAGETVCLLGRNGAGKTTTMLAVAGACKGARGSVRIDGRDVVGLAPARVAAAGIALVPEGHRIFRGLSVGENLRIGAFLRRRDSRAVRQGIAEVIDLFPALRGREHQVAGELSGGEQQMVALGQALMASPRALLLDEPSAGLAPMLVEAIYGAIERLRQRGMAILVVEQTVDRALAAASRAYVMEGGRIVLEGDSEQLRHDGRVEAVVLGGAVSADS